MANETTSIFDSTPDSQMYEYKQSIEKVQTELLKYGLTSNQSNVFIYLGKYGAKTAPEVCKALKLPRTETYHLLSALQNKGIVSATFQHPIQFNAVPIRQGYLDFSKFRKRTSENTRTNGKRDYQNYGIIFLPLIQFMVRLKKNSKCYKVQIKFIQKL